MSDETAVKSEYASVNGLKMYYEIHGAGRPLVLLHGSFMGSVVYPDLVEGRQIIAVDLQGHGRTADIDRPFSFEQMADDTAALIEQLEIGQTDVFGYSMGGTIGLALAIRHPHLVGRLAVFGSVYKPIEESFTPETFAPKELKEPYEKISPAPNWKKLVAKILQMEKDFKGFSAEQMKAIEAEVFIGVGDRNDMKLEHIVEMHNLIPKSQLAVFPNTEHVVLFTEPEKVISQIKAFLNDRKK